MPYSHNYNSYSSQNLFRMPFGKFKHEPIADIPSAYLCWLVENNVAKHLHEPIRSELCRRFAPQDEGGADA
jgi:hypothetical protein